MTKSPPPWTAPRRGTSWPGGHQCNFYQKVLVIADRLRTTVVNIVLIVVMDQGEVMEKGSHQEMVAKSVK